MKRLLSWLSRLAPRWRRDEWLREWSSEIDATGRARPVADTLGAAAHVAWLWRHEWCIDMIGADTRFALRTLLGRPAFTLTVLMTLALGIGATTAMFTIVDAVLLRALPYPNADRIVVIWPRVTLSPHELEEATRPRRAFDALGAYSSWGFTLTGGNGAEAVPGARVTPDLLRLLNVRPLLGRWFEAEESRAGQDHVAVISEGLWGRRFGRDPAAVGGHLELEGVDYLVVGVMPQTFEFPNNRSDVWTPLTMAPATGDYDANFATLIGRLSAGGSVAAAREEMRVYADQLHRKLPKTFDDRFLDRTVVVPLQSLLVQDIRRPLLLLFIAVGILLLMACANTALLVLSRAGSREMEVAVRSALGATRQRIIRQLLIEGAVLAAVGGVSGLLLAYWLVHLMVPFVPDLPQITRAAIDGRVIGFTCLVAVGSVILSSLAPAWDSSRSEVQTVLASGRGAGRSPRRGAVGKAIVGTEVALATMLVAASALLGRSFEALTRVDLGFRHESVLTLRTSAPEFKYPEDDRVRLLFDDVLQRLRAIPGVQAAGAIHLMPLTPDNWNPGVTVDGLAATEQYQSDVNWRVVTPDYFRALGIPVRKGRAFTGADDQRGMPVALVNEAFVRAVFHHQNPLGRRIRTAFEGRSGWATIVGIVGDVRQHTVDQPAVPEMYRPFAQHPLASMRVMVKVEGDPAAAAPAIRVAIASVDRDIAIADLQPLSGVVDHALGGVRLPLMLSALFSIVAMTLGVIGVVGVLSFDVAERRSEIGVRLALGASPSTIHRWFLVRGLWLGVSGVAAGIVAALGVAGLLRSMLFGISPTDPATLAAVSAAFLGVIALAAYVPARWAAQVDPLTTLRSR